MYCILILLLLISILEIWSRTNENQQILDFLSWNPRIIHHESFLSIEECDFIISYTKNTSQYARINDQSYKSVYLPEYPKLPKLLQGIERRIGVITE